MTQLRFLIDDFGQCRTQRAVLSAFAGSLPPHCLVTWSSSLPAPQGWDDAPAESRQRLAARLAAMEPAADRVTVFLPGHVVPGEVHGFDPAAPRQELPGTTTAAELDLFVVDNGNPLLQAWQQERADRPDYESCSGRNVAAFTAVPSSLCAGGLASALLLTQRPWYTVDATTRKAWLAWVGRALQQQLLTLGDVEADVREGLVRPSLLADARALAQGVESPAFPDATLDALFTCPERRLSDAQHRLLHSQELQERTLRHAKVKAARKAAAVKAAGRPARTSPGWRLLLRPARLARFVVQHGLHYAYQVYAATLRPLIRRSGQRSDPP